MLEKFSRVINQLSKLFYTDACFDKEREDILNSLTQWLKNRKRTFQRVDNKRIGDVYLFSFGLNSLPCISYFHMGIVISKTDKYLYILPITSYKEEIHNKAYHPTLSNPIKNEFYLMKKTDFSFLSHDSVIKPSDIRCMASIDTMTFKGRININDSFFKEIYEMCFASVFYNKYKRYNSLELQLIKQLENELLEENIIVHMNDSIDINKYIRGYYGSLKDEINIDTSKAGIYSHTITFIDNFENEVSKEFTVIVKDFAEKKPSDIKELVGGAV